MSNALRMVGRQPRAATIAVPMLALAVAFAEARGQAVFEDGDGRTSILVPWGTFVGINTGDASIELGAFSLVSNRAVFGGAAVRAGSADGLAPIFGAGRVQPGATGRAVLGYKLSGQTYVAVQYRREYAGVALIDTAATVSTIANRTVNGWEAAGHFSSTPVDWLAFGIAAGRRKLNDYEDLSRATVRTLRVDADPATGNVVEVVRTRDGRIGPLHEMHATFVDADALFLPFGARPVSTRAFVRLFPDRPDRPFVRNGGGIDIGVHKQGGDAVLDRRVALVVELVEALPGDDEETRSWKRRVAVSFVANVAPLIGRLVGAMGG